MEKNEDNVLQELNDQLLRKDDFVIPVIIMNGVQGNILRKYVLVWGKISMDGTHGMKGTVFSL